MAPFPTQGAPMQFERERYPTYMDEDDDAAVVAEQQRVLKAALPITVSRLCAARWSITAMVSAARSPARRSKCSWISAPHQS